MTGPEVFVPITEDSGGRTWLADSAEGAGTACEAEWTKEGEVGVFAAREKPELIRSMLPESAVFYPKADGAPESCPTKLPPLPRSRRRRFRSARNSAAVW